ncbi:hypothetical protein [Streptomyces sp. NBC_00094]|uniref:hypothetical protein n=1 Tax=Streptomyces sp. NBC_00094 TaxID=2903620 RepID=UPI0022534128|nr:hypothetical protein [Streptomyces sp. NBC_00094]MCX5391544.1 hypothetical protein [Streptomyces sp. NBC_00094]
MKSLTWTPAQPGSAEQPITRPAVGASKVVAEGVPSAVRPDPHPATGPRVVGMLHITLPDRSTIPTATSRCECGRDMFAVGHHQVLALVADHTAHRALCPLLTEGEAA